MCRWHVTVTAAIRFAQCCKIANAAILPTNFRVQAIPDSCYEYGGVKGWSTASVGYFLFKRRGCPAHRLSAKETNGPIQFHLLTIGVWQQHQRVSVHLVVASSVLPNRRPDYRLTLTVIGRRTVTVAGGKSLAVLTQHAWTVCTVSTMLAASHHAVSW
jgi:hypothetical protein